MNLITFTISKVLSYQRYGNVSFSRYLIFPLCLMTANAYGSNTQLHLTQKTDTFANINHVDIQGTFDVREYRDMMLYVTSLSNALVSNVRKEPKLNSCFTKKGIHVQDERIALSRYS